MPPELERRRIATQRTFDRFSAKHFEWRRGVHCVAMVRCQLTGMGHTVPTLPRVRSALAARRALAARGWASVTAMLDALLPESRIAPAAMLLGDIAAVPGSDGFDALLVRADTHLLMGWHPVTGEFTIYDGGDDQIAAAWRV